MTKKVVVVGVMAVWVECRRLVARDGGGGRGSVRVTCRVPRKGLVWWG